MPRSMFTTDYECLIALMADIRKEQNITQTDLALSLGKPQSFISKIENGERRLDLIEMIAIADAMDVEPSDILDRLEQQISRPVRI